MNQDISPNKRKQGIYKVGDNEYSNKNHALINCSAGQYPKFDFNDDVFSQFDWTLEPTLDLYELYKLRAIQIREKYDNVLINYSGGIDSTCVLRSFIDNDIKIDGVIIYGTWSIDKQNNLLSNLEQRLVGFPYLAEMQKKQKFPIHCLDTTPFFENYKDPYWVFSVNQFHPQNYVRNFFDTDPWIQKFLMTGSTCFVSGIDKPRVVYDSELNKWCSGFLDQQIISAGLHSGRHDWDIQEYFFWSPDLPELPIKQAHMVLHYLKKIVNGKEIFEIHNGRNFNSAEYYKITDPVVYGKYVKQAIGGDRPYYTVPKMSTSSIITPKDNWFFSKELENEPFVKMYHQGLNFLQKNLDKSFLNNPSKSLFETTTIGSWSKMYALEK